MTALTKMDDTNLVQAGSLMEVISRAASDPNTDVEKLERLMAMYERITSREAEQAFNQAMQVTQSRMKSVSADMNNPQTRSKYASYAALDRALRPTYTEQGFSLSFDTGDGAPEGYIRVLAYVAHNSGYTRTYKADMPSDGKGAKGGDVMTKTHAAGAGMSYGMRYLLKMIFNVAVGEDDADGNTPVALISKEQKQELIKAIEKTPKPEGMSKTQRFLNYASVASLDELPASRYAKCKETLDRNAQ